MQQRVHRERRNPLRNPVVRRLPAHHATRSRGYTNRTARITTLSRRDQERCRRRGRTPRRTSGVVADPKRRRRVSPRRRRSDAFMPEFARRRLTQGYRSRFEQPAVIYRVRRRQKLIPLFEHAATEGVPYAFFPVEQVFRRDREPFEPSGGTVRVARVRRDRLIHRLIDLRSEER